MEQTNKSDSPSEHQVSDSLKQDPARIGSPEGQVTDEGQHQPVEGQGHTEQPGGRPKPTEKIRETARITWGFVRKTDNASRVQTVCTALLLLHSLLYTT